MKTELIAYLGIPGSFTHSAAIGYFGESASLRNYSNFKKIFAAVESKECAFGIVPMENSLAGSIYENYDLLRSSPLRIIGETLHKVEHNLCVCDGDTSLTHVFSHPKALEQIANFLAANPQLKLIAHSDTASAALHVSESKNPHFAAVCSQAAAKIYGLNVIKKNIEDDPQNYTRFAVITSTHLEVNDADKCSLLFVLPHVPKSLFHAVEKIVSAAINITKIESRPIPGKPFEYVFYLDFEFAPADRSQVDQMLERLKSYVTELKLLGFYKRSTL